MDAKTFCENSKRSLSPVSQTMKDVKTFLRYVQQNPDTPLEVSKELVRLCFALNDAIATVDKACMTLSYIGYSDYAKEVNMYE